jgi:phosphoribosylglycinamide formyltransferase-1
MRGCWATVGRVAPSLAPRFLSAEAPSPPPFGRRSREPLRSAAMRFAVLASGAGSNLQALIDRAHGHHGNELVAVGSDRDDAPALDRARTAGIAVQAFPATRYGRDREARDAAIAQWLQSEGAELVVLAGYRQLVSPGFLDAFPQRVINVHPALLPAFPGLHVVQAALDYGVKVFGVTVHFVDTGVDTGPIIFQRALELPDATDVDEVLERLHPVEHELLVEAVHRIAEGAVGFDPDNPRRVRVSQ